MCIILIIWIGWNWKAISAHDIVLRKTQKTVSTGQNCFYWLSVYLFGTTLQQMDKRTLSMNIEMQYCDCLMLKHNNKVAERHTHIDDIDLHILFIDFKSAFGSVNRRELIHTKHNLGVPRTLG